MKTSFVIFPIAVLSIGAVLLAGVQVPTKPKTVWDGVYTAEQATRGEQSYKESCARCHGATLEGTQGNGLRGHDFMEKWREDSVGSVFVFISENMPPIR